MKYYQLNALVAIADAGSIRHAAKILQTSPAAITKAIQKLETDTTLQLVIRNSTGITFTAEGEKLLVQARLLVAQMQTAQQIVVGCKGEMTGRLSVAVTPWVVMTILPRVISLFQERYPKVQLDLHEGLVSIAYPKLRDGSLDLLIGRLSTQGSSTEFQYQPLFSSEFTVVARQHHPLANSRTLDDLSEAQWILPYIPEDFPFPSRVHMSNSLSIAMSLLRNTDMLSIFPWPLVEECTQREGLCALPLRESMGEALVGMINRVSQPTGPIAGYFATCLVRVLREEMSQSSSPYQRILHSVDLLV
ncbi:TPA: LysR family transcriptional regulator [Raoultella planticola]|uniref:LysR family transcriptional regulator n=1 Tax=Raoultella planticola TaxID=575 RepID=UPI001A1AEDA9|nr:LysR family transcriptional regulator [Raoultella planticola]HAT1618747.1 LysR family transcriptional regulator [Raoultella planticola]HAT1645713.1 LysR family transcriptional regulator [Raoultella planticola]